MDEEPAPKIRLIVEDRAPSINEPSRLRLYMETPANYTWPEGFMLIVLVVPRSAGIDITPPAFELDPTLGEEGAQELELLATLPGEHTLRIEVMDRRSGQMLQVLEATISVAIAL